MSDDCLVEGRLRMNAICRRQRKHKGREVLKVSKLNEKERESIRRS